MIALLIPPSMLLVMVIVLAMILWLFARRPRWAVHPPSYCFRCCAIPRRRLALGFAAIWWL